MIKLSVAIFFSTIVAVALSLYLLDDVKDFHFIKFVDGMLFREFYFIWILLGCLVLGKRGNKFTRKVEDDRSSMHNFWLRRHHMMGNEWNKEKFSLIYGSCLRWIGWIYLAISIKKLVKWSMLHSMISKELQNN